MCLRSGNASEAFFFWGIIQYTINMQYMGNAVIYNAVLCESERTHVETVKICN